MGGGLVMRTGRLASAWQKFDRAEYHRKLLEADIDRIQAEAEDIPVKTNVEWNGHTILNGQLYARGVATVILETMPTVCYDFPLILGDAIGNYRAALDHLTWAMVKRFGAKLTAKQARWVQFPMHNSARDFDTEKSRRTPGVPDNPHRAILKRYQPYARGEGPRGVRWIRSLADVDKHRVVPIVVMARRDNQATYSVSGGAGIVGGVTDLVERARPLKAGTPLAKLDLVWPAHVTQFDVKVDGKMTILPVIRTSVAALGAACALADARAVPLAA